MSRPRYSFATGVAMLLAFLVAGAPCVVVAQAVPELRFTVSRFVVSGDNPLPADQTEATLAPFEGEFSGVDGLLEAADALERALEDAGFAFHRVSLPPQQLDGGTVTLNVLRFDLGKVVVEGNSHFSDENIVASLPPLVPGTSPNTESIALAVAAANRHPAKKLAVTIRQGEQPDTVDAVVRARDERPWKLFALFNNIGSPQTHRSRLSVGAQHSNLFDLDHVLTGSWTTSPEGFGDVKQGGVSYQIPVYAWHGWLSFTYVHSDVDSGQVLGGLDVSGSGDFLTASFRQELPRAGALRHAWNVSLNDRKFDDDVVFFGVPIGNDVRSRPLVLGWEGELVRVRGSLRGYADFSQNLGGGSDNDSLHYALARLGADRSWNRVRGGFDVVEPLPAGWLAHGRFDAQYAGETLIPGEQFGIGGATSVRGFEERAVTADNGLTASAEIWTPPIGALHGLRLLGFVDAGVKDLEDPQVGEESFDQVWSAGFGVRWGWKESLTMSLDYGRVLKQAKGATQDAGNTRWHLSVLYRY